MSVPEIQFLGIRHHGPGSARRMLRFLEKWQPDAIIIEAPAEISDLFASVNDPGLIPPIALLLYEPLKLKNSLILPFAHFSPEWIAISFANSKGIPLIPFDLPAALMLPLSQETEIIRDDYVKDPLSQVAQLSGYTDSERWWEHTFEQIREDEDVFKGLQEVMIEVRSQLNRTESRETLLREAWMPPITASSARPAAALEMSACWAMCSINSDLFTKTSLHSTTKNLSVTWLGCPAKTSAGSKSSTRS